MRRVVVTGIGGLTPLGTSWNEIETKLRAGYSGIRSCEEWSEYHGLRSRIAGRVSDDQVPPHWDRKVVRGMSRGSLLATLATEKAIVSAGLSGHPILTSGEAGVAYGSCLGGPDALIQLASGCMRKDMRGLPASSYVKVMSHCCASNISLFFGLRGRLLPTCSACTSGSQAIGLSYETIKEGRQKVMLAGGAEELCVGITALFDAMFATSSRNDSPGDAARPFDATRDGIVISEGACSLILEDLDHALARGARIVAEVAGFGTNCSGTHVTVPDAASMSRVMRMALADARIEPSEIGYVHAHATATDLGDVAEAQSTAEVFGPHVPVGALKSYIGHTLGGAGGIEAWLAIEMMNAGWFAPVRNLTKIDERCQGPAFIQHEGVEKQCRYVMTNNFAFGGVNTSLVFKRWEP